ncbi:hypothetical protein [Phenylobacterium sp.]|uniref:hypothetical protein n=1 Tax=Phenylobacterium sp. TaxID=1871053 RepID=UPI00286B5241|nr:hypothetical protein [Phenylobacterium sp.]
MTTDSPDALADVAALLMAAPTAWDAIADTRRRLALRAWRAWPAELPSEIAPPSGVSDLD